MRQPLIDDEVMRRLAPQISSAAELIRSAVSCGRPILLRYNNDADGICAGLSIYCSILSIAGAASYDAKKLLRDYQNNSAIYNHGDASGDILLLRGISEARPLVVLVDFGANPESVDGLRSVKAEGAQLLVIDHHPPGADAVKLLDVFVSPWLARGGTSDYCAGLLAGEVAKELGLDAGRLQRVALTGDRSKLIQPSEEERNASLALDYLAETAKPRNTLSHCNSIFSDAKKLESTYGLAISKLEQARASIKALARTRQLPNGFTVALADISKMARDSSFPPKGKLTGALHDSLAPGIHGPLVTIGYGGDAINFRANAAARAAGCQLL